MRARATAIGFGAILLWSLLALFTVGTVPVPPFLLNALTFSIGGLVGLIWIGLSGGFGQLGHVQPKTYLLGATGLFGYHFLYFSALRLAPPAEAGLICYLWPLFIVLFSGLLPGERLTPLHVAGAAVAFAGTAWLLLGKGGGFDGSWLGFLLAFLAALTWASYSLLSRRMGEVPTAAVAVFCLITAALSVPFHVALETTAWPVGLRGWLCVIALGLGPVGLAFYVWDVGVKRGDIQMLGTASYAAPLLSTLTLIASGVAEPTARIGVAAMCITAGAGLAAWASSRARPVEIRPGSTD
ncbi:EamA family transporter [Frigidibacter sp. RF13]|uniref:aromatic amino acid exporter YddG n=1 Tax=Frigidibacter sp. RF13 TaxID=2997340 RepID=UPI00226E21BD|nr:EamA family transporter [Frigidibacter sp. RF13]MCY1128147.1 EamA family transporter [Frigidibacter sp. RF13]